jgi:trimeric autotransporter adhesin
MKQFNLFAVLMLLSGVLHAQIITTFAGTGFSGYNGENIPATDANISGPKGLATDAQGNIYVAVSGEYRVRKITPDGIITTIAGDGTYGFSGDGGPAVNAQLSNNVYGIAIAGDGSIYLCDEGNNRLRKIDKNGIISTIAGTGENGDDGDGGLGTAAKLRTPRSVCIDDNGNIFIADAVNDRIRKIDKDGIITTIAGTGVAGYSGDGSAATVAELNTPMGVAFDNDGNLHIADHGNRRVRKIDRFGIITTVAGSGVPGFAGDGGPATAANFSAVRDIKFDIHNNFYFPDPGTNRVRKVSAEGIISTVAGCDESIFGGDGGPATAAGLSSVNAVTIGLDGSLLISDFTHMRIRRVSNVVAVSDANAIPGGVFIFPNPNKGSFSVNLPAQYNDADISVFDVLGRKIDVRQKTNGHTVSVDMDVPAGQYVVVSAIDGAVYRTVISVTR